MQCNRGPQNSIHGELHGKEDGTFNGDYHLGCMVSSIKAYQPNNGQPNGGQWRTTWELGLYRLDLMGSCRSLNNYQHHVEVYLRHSMPLLMFCGQWELLEVWIFGAKAQKCLFFGSFEKIGNI